MSGVDQFYVDTRNQMVSSKEEHPAASQKQWSERDCKSPKATSWLQNITDPACSTKFSDYSWDALL